MSAATRLAAFAALALVSAMAACWSPSPAAGAAPVNAADEELARAYAPVLRLKEQSEACGPGEPFQPLDVNLILPSPEVALRGPWDATNIVRIAPTGRDLRPGLHQYAIDFPGSALDPGCDYERWSKRLTRGRAPTTYARIVTERGEPGRLALQYWFFYVFNDFNNTHEGDWEMIQLLFDAPDARAALARGPTEVGYSQHEGAERATWGDAKLELVDGTHPVVYPAAGSHANYFSSALYLGRTAREGLGCDDTTGPSRQARPDVLTVPTARGDYLRAYPWLGFAGRWGERRPAFFDGPLGPNAKVQWTRPISWAETEWRDRSFVVPAGGAAGSTATGFFCGTVGAASEVVRVATASPWPFAAVLGALVLLLVWAATRTSWRPSAPFRLAHRRAWGQILAASWRMYSGHAGLFLGIGLLFIPIGAATALLQQLIFRVGGLDPLVQTAGERNGLVAGLALSLGVVLTLLGYALVQAATARAMVELDAGRRVSAPAAYRGVRDSVRPLLGALAITVAAQFVLDLTVIGIALALFLLVRWSLLAIVVEVEEHGARGSLRRSARLVSGHWWRVFGIVVVVAGAGLLVGPLVGALALLATGAAFAWVNLIAAVVSVLVMPFAAIATTYIYFDLRVRKDLAPAAETRVQELPAMLDLSGSTPAAGPGPAPPAPPM